LAVAHWLAGQPAVGTMLHPAIPGCPGHEHWQRDFRGTSGLFGFTLKDADKAQRAAFIDALTLFGIGYSWGGFESLVVPANPPRNAVPWQSDGPLVRLSIGLEEPADLIADLNQALKAAGLKA
jgi:cystathionine beta-lyase